MKTIAAIAVAVLSGLSAGADGAVVLLALQGKSGFGLLSGNENATITGFEAEEENAARESRLMTCRWC